ncbi:uncharacterized protein LOC62_03G004622 [Vanrija pseudolonga]|uniref:Uncharacterized protein n=1 Tax=Vanrija pseudolonga TaxID=143232 RepID=A0AAF0Y6E0_9TREE|nr:hypothetical protein LOC62_03G004622 [Vanrija pseudolonga]
MASPPPSAPYEQVHADRAVHSWPGAHIVLSNRDGVAIVAVPLEFALGAGLSTWRLLGEALEPILVDDTGGREGEGEGEGVLLWKDADGGLLNVDEGVVAGEFVVLWLVATSGPVIPSFPIGPSTDTLGYEKSWDATTDASFESRVRTRDGACVVSGVRNFVDAARLVRKDDTEGYELAARHEWPTHPNSSRAGIRLWVPLRRMYEAYDAAFFPKVDKMTGETTFTWHLFILPFIDEHNEPTVRLLRGYHGATRTWIDGAPSRALAMAHYRRVMGKRLALVRRVAEWPERTPTPSPTLSPAPTPSQSPSPSPSPSPMKRKLSSPVQDDSPPHKEARTGD